MNFEILSYRLINLTTNKLLDNSWVGDAPTSYQQDYDET